VYAVVAEGQQIVTLGRLVLVIGTSLPLVSGLACFCTNRAKECD